MLELIGSYLRAGVMENEKDWSPAENGTPQGSVISPLLSNIYLDPLDWLMAQSGLEMVRYADDFVILCRSQEETQRALETVQSWVKQAGLTLHPQKTQIVDARERGGFDFLGYHFERGIKWPRKKSMDKLKDTIRAKTRRCSGQSLQSICGNLNRTLRGWFEYFKHSKRSAFETVDGYIRGRLRNMLRRRAGKKGRAYVLDHCRWPNACFTAMGLYSLTGAHKAACQSS